MSDEPEEVDDRRCTVQYHLSGHVFDNGLEPDDLLMDALVVMRVKDINNSSYVVIASTEATDNVVVSGLIQCLIDDYRRAFIYQRPITVGDDD